MTTADVQELISRGDFHHATHRPQQFDSLFIYQRDDDGFRGYTLFGGVSNRTDPTTFAQVSEIVRHTGISVGAFGNG
jgi:hypothetical protein